MHRPRQLGRVGFGDAGHVLPVKMVDHGPQVSRHDPAALDKATLDADEHFVDDPLGQPAQHDTAPAVTPAGNAVVAERLKTGAPRSPPGLVVRVAQAVDRTGHQAPAGHDRADPQRRTGCCGPGRLVAVHERCDGLAPGRSHPVAAQAQAVSGGGPAGTGDIAHCAEPLAGATPIAHPGGHEVLEGLIGAHRSPPCAPAAELTTAPCLVAAARHSTHLVAEQPMRRVGGEHLGLRIPTDADERGEVHGGGEPSQSRIGRASDPGRSRTSHGLPVPVPKPSGPRRSTAARMTSMWGCR